MNLELKRPPCLDAYEVAMFMSSVDYDESEIWKDAIKQEINALNDNETWTYVSRPDNCKLIDCKWVFRRKKDENGNIKAFKARLVAREFQHEGIDQSEIYSPVAKLSSLLVFLAICNEYS